MEYSKEMNISLLFNIITPLILIILMIASAKFSNYLTFHFIAEMFSIFTALAISLVTYFTYHLTKNKYLLFLGFGYFWIGILDTFHTQTYFGMNIFDTSGMDTTLTFWISARFMEASIFILAVFLSKKDFLNIKVFFTLGLYSTFIFIVAINYPLSFFIEGVGLTLSKIIIEYIIIIILLIAVKLNSLHKNEFNASIYKAIQLAIIFTIISEALFTLYIDAYGFTNILGHIFKFLSFWILFISVIRTSFHDPIKLMSKDTQSYHLLKKLDKQHTILNSVINSTPDLIFYKDYLNQEGRYVGCNNAFSKFAGKSNEEITGHTDIELFGEELGNFFREKDKLVFEKAKTVINEEWVEYPDGSKVLFSTSKAPFYNENQMIIGVMGVSRDITKQKTIENELREQKSILDYQAHHDALTGLPNRILFNDRLVQSIEKAKRNNTKIALLFIDLDHFKEVNDSLGHDIGDEILKEVTHRLSKTIRDEDTVARLGGDEFTVILEELIQGQDVSSVATKILKSLAKSMNVNDNILYVSSSIGVSIYPDDGTSAQDLLKYADSAMYKAKDEGRNNFQYYNSTMTELALERVVMETSLRAALKNNELVVYYQPQVNGTTNKLIGMEALVRWQHPTMGLVSPAKFIPLAESTGLIIELDRYVMKTALTQVSEWYKEGLNPGILSMNLAVKQLDQEDFVSMFQQLIKETNCKEKWLELEVTEGGIMTHPEKAIVTLQAISDLGIEVAVDDFGTGYSSLAYLKRLPIDKLKIDQAFVRGLPDDEEDAGITKAVIALAKSLNLKVIAEGVETKEQKDFLVEHGCNNIQGYFYSKPIPAKEFENILKNGF